jgi:hypothetical protein
MKARPNTFALIALFLLAPATLTRADLEVDEKGFAKLQAGDEVWGDYPGIAGIKRMVVYGDPSKQGVYVIRGTWWSGTGPDFAPDKTESMRPGAYMLHPAGEAHFDGAKDEEVVVQLIGVGPSGTKFIHPELGTVGHSQ